MGDQRNSARKRFGLTASPPTLQ